MPPTTRQIAFSSAGLLVEPHLHDCLLSSIQLDGHLELSFLDATKTRRIHIVFPDHSRPIITSQGAVIPSIIQTAVKRGTSEYEFVKEETARLTQQIHEVSGGETEIVYFTCSYGGPIAVHGNSDLLAMTFYYVELLGA